VRASGVLKQSRGLRGPWRGGSASSPAMTACSFMVDGSSYMFIPGPDVVRTVTREEVTMQDLGGAKTHGKGTVQNVLPLQSMLSNKLRKTFPEDIAGALKLTTHKFYRVSGGSTQYKGVEPDIVLPSPYDGMDVTEEHLDYSLPWDEITPIPHKDYGLVQPSLSFLKTNSAKRISRDPEFRYLREDFEYRDEMEKKNRITLNFQKRLDEKNEFSKRDDAREEERRLRLPLVQSLEKGEKVVEAEDGEDSDQVVVPDFILDVSLLILRDYITHRNRWVADVSPHKETL